MPRLATLLALLVVLASGCADETTETDAALQPPPDSLLLYPGEIALAQADSVTNAETRPVALTSVVPTEDGCFVMVEAGGAQELLMASPEACEAAAPLEGQRVVLTQGDAEVAVEGCEGPGCPEGGTAPLVVGVAAAE